MIYIFCFAWAVFIYLAFPKDVYCRFAGLICALFPSFLIVVTRGEKIGTDTPVYIGIAQNIVTLPESYMGEKGFFYLVKSFMWFTEQPYYAILLCSGLLFYLLACGAWKLDKSGTLMILLILPYFAFDYSMNALRSGISFALFLNFVGCKKRGVAFLFFVLSVSFHISVLILYFLWFLHLARSYREYLVAVSLSAFFGGIFFFYQQEYILLKFADYELFASPNKFSGISVLLLSVLLLFTLLMNSRLKKLVYLPLSLVLLNIGFFILARYSYAGLRLMSAAFFFYVVVIFYQIKILRFDLDSKTRFCFFIIGLFGFFFQWKNYYLVGAAGGYFLPYTSILEGLT